MWKPILVAILLSACTTSPDAAIPRLDACQEQATAWCARGGYAGASGSGCRIVYTYQWCAPAGWGGGDTIKESAQDACLDAIASASPGAEPPECRLTWN